MKTLVLALLAAMATAGCVVAPAQPGYYGPPRAYVNPTVVIGPPRGYYYPPPVVWPARPYYGPGYWYPRNRGYY